MGAGMATRETRRFALSLLDLTQAEYDAETTKDPGTVYRVGDQIKSFGDVLAATPGSGAGSGTSFTEDSATGTATLDIDGNRYAALPVVGGEVGYNLLTLYRKTFSDTGPLLISRAEDLTYSPLNVGDSILLGKMHKVTVKNGTSDITGYGHVVASIAWTVMDMPGKAANLLIAGESKLENLNGSITNAIVQENQMATNAGAIDTLALSSSRVIVNSGTINKAIGHQSSVEANSGTIGSWYGFYNPDMSVVIGAATRRSFLNEDPGAPAVSKAPFISQAVQATGVLDGQNLVVNNNVSDLIIIPAATLTALTITLPSAPIDGQELSIKTTQAITTLTLSGNGRGMIDTLTTLAASGYATFKFLGVSNSWYRKG